MMRKRIDKRLQVADERVWKSQMGFLIVEKQLEFESKVFLTSKPLLSQTPSHFQRSKATGNV